VRLAAMVALLALLSACSQPAEGDRAGMATGERLQGAVGAYREIDNAFVFSVPDSGGFVANSTPIDSLVLDSLLAGLFQGWPPKRRAVFVWDNPRRRSAINWIRQAAERAGGKAFDADLSGWPHQMPAPPP
jgi:hypothetical protein